jgi:hypothetical protein
MPESPDEVFYKNGKLHMQLMWRTGFITASKKQVLWKTGKSITGGVASNGGRLDGGYIALPREQIISSV